LIAAAVERTAGSGIAKVCLESVSDTKSRLASPQPSPVRQSGLRGVLSRAGGKAFELGITQMLKHADQVLRAEGFLDFESRRCAIDFGAYAELVDGSSQWSGRSGRAIATLPEEAAQSGNPLWLFDLLRGVAEGRRWSAGRPSPDGDSRPELRRSERGCHGGGGRPRFGGSCPDPSARRREPASGSAFLAASRCSCYPHARVVGSRNSQKLGGPSSG
jgi:hypothetical protein